MKLDEDGKDGNASRTHVHQRSRDPVLSIASNATSTFSWIHAGPAVSIAGCSQTSPTSMIAFEMR